MRYFYHIYILIIACLLLNTAKAQKQADWWYFGNYAGVHFVNGVPKGVTNGQCYTYEGCAVVSDANGNLLMYTDGSYVWNNKHQVMQNGSGLLGNFSATQSGVIVPKPGSKNIHYVFSIDAYPGTNGLHYSIVDMSYNSGLGKVTTQNVALSSDLLEKLSAVKHANGTDYWVLSLSNSCDSIYAYLVNSSGVKSTPVISYSGGNTSNSVCLGYFKASPDGSHVAYCQTGLNSLYYGDFDASTGKCSMSKLDSIPDCYGVEFSASSNKLYAINNSAFLNGHIYQYNTKAGSVAQIKSSKQTIYTTTDSLLAAIQLGPNGNIYLTRSGAKVLGELTFADSTYPTCKYKWNAVDLKGRETFDGLPTFIQSFFLQVKFNYSDVCVLGTTKFSVVDSSKADSVLWVFGDSATGSNDSSISMSAEHQFSRAGTFKVSLYYWHDSIPYSSFENITVDSIPQSYLPKDTIICGTTKTNLTVPKKESYFYMWNTGDTTNSILVDTPGIYWVEISNDCGSIRDSINIIKYDKPIVSLGNDTTYCDSFSRTFDVTNPSCKYLWNTGDTIPQITIKKFGIYWVKVSNPCYIIYDSIKIDSLSIPKPKLGNDTLYCGSFSRKFNVLQKFATYLWNTGDTVSSFTINSKGTYIVNITNICGTGKDTINIDNMLQVAANLGKDSVYCNAKTILLDAKNVVFNPYISKNRYIWSTGDTTQTIQVQPIGAIWVKVYNACFTSYDTVSLILKSAPHPNLGNDTFTCNNTISYNIDVAHPYSSYLWSSGDTSSNYNITKPGTYWVKAYNECGQNFDTLYINKLTMPTVNLPNDTFYCSAFDQTLDATFNGANYIWNTGDTLPVIHATGTGLYEVIVRNGCGSATDSISILLYNPPTVLLGNDTSYCSNFNQKLDVYNPLCNYIWSTGDTVSSILVNKAGIYYVNIYNKCWQQSDTITIEQPLQPIVNLGSDTTYCGLFSRDFDVTSNIGDKYKWNTNDTIPIYHITSPNTYSVKIFNACFSASDSIVVNQLFSPQINLGNDTVFCADFNYTIDAKNVTYNYIWSTGDTSSYISTALAGNYWVEAINYCGSATDSINIIRVYRPAFLDLGNDTIICFNASINISQAFGNIAHIWNNGDTSSSLSIIKPGTYWTKVTDQSCDFFDTIKIANFPHKILNLGEDTTLCVDQHDTIVFNGGHYVLYNWQPMNITADSIQVTTPGIYTLFVTDTFGCNQSDSVQVTEVCPPKIWMPNSFTPGHKDTLNDVFKPTLFMVDSYTLDIYSRWGEHIYTGTQKDAGWDGTYRGGNCSADIYIWVVKYDSHLLPKYTRGGNASGVVYIIR